MTIDIRRELNIAEQENVCRFVQDLLHYLAEEGRIDTSGLAHSEELHYASLRLAERVVELVDLARKRRFGDYTALLRQFRYGGK